MKICIVKGCTSDQVDRFPFPLDRPALNDAWIKSLQNHQEVPIVDYSSYFVCPKHFSKKDYIECTESSLQLNADAVPSLFPTQELSNPFGLFLNKNEPVDIEDLPIDFLKESGNDSNDILLTKSTNRYFVYKKETNSKGQLTVEETERESQEEENSLGGCESSNGPLIEDNVHNMQSNLLETKEELEKSQEILQSMLNILNSQKETISKLEAELATLEGTNSLEIKCARENYFSKEKSNWPKREDFNDVDLQVFCISLYYFSPNVFAYMSSIIPRFPSKQVIAEWITSGLASKIFPQGVLDVNKININ